MTREEAIQVLNTYDVNFDEYTAEEIADSIDMAIEALSADAVHGEWLHNAFYSGNEYKCSVCGETFKFLMGANYCPNCGARMYKGGGNK